jgi:hypothetical protein
LQKIFALKKKKFFFTLLVVCSISSKHSLLVFAGSDLVERGLAAQGHPYNTPRTPQKSVAISQPSLSSFRAF